MRQLDSMTIAELDNYGEAISLSHLSEAEKSQLFADIEQAKKSKAQESPLVEFGELSGVDDDDFYQE